MNTSQLACFLAVAETPPEAGSTDVPQEPFLLALDGVGDPGNFGTICRTLRAAGLSELWYTKGSIDPYGDKAVRSALGAQFSLKLRSFEDLAGLSGAARRPAKVDFRIVFARERVYNESGGLRTNKGCARHFERTRRLL